MKQYQKDIRAAVRQEKIKYHGRVPDYLKTFGHDWDFVIKLLEAQYRPPVQHSTLREFIAK